MTNLNAHLERFQTAYKDLFHVIRTYPETLREQSGACGFWSPRQVLAHLSGWLVEGDTRFRLYEKEESTAPKRYDMDVFNAESVAARAHLTWEETINELRSNENILVQHVQKVITRGETHVNGYAKWLDALAEDCEAHTEQIRTFAKESA